MLCIIIILYNPKTTRKRYLEFMAMPLAILGQHDQLYNKKYTLPTYGLVEYIGPQF